jgi:hypothetical protein
MISIIADPSVPGPRILEELGRTVSENVIDGIADMGKVDAAGI